MIKIIEKNTSELIPYENNARFNDKAVEAVANSIKEFGIKNPIIIDKDNVIIAGHTRIKACKELGIDKVPCIVADDLTDDQVKAFRIADNSTAQIAEWDLDKLKVELDSIDMDMVKFGLDEQMEDIQSMLDSDADVKEDNYDGELPEEPKSKLGDIYQLGNHRLMCGNSTDLSDVKKLVNGSSISLVVTDPPYNMNYKGAGNASKSARKRVIKNDHMSDDKFDKFLDDMYKVLYEVMDDDSSIYVFYKELGNAAFLNAMDRSSIEFKQELIWVKNQLVLGGSKYQNMYEPFLFGCKGKVGKWNGKRKQRNVIESIDLMNEIELREAIRDLLDNEVTDVVREKKQLKNDLHPTMKPIKLLAKLIENSSDTSDNVLDIFGGSGSTLIACEQLDRSCYMMELDPKYVDVIIDRWETFTNKKAIKITEE